MDEIGKLVRAFKYAGRDDLDGVLGNLLAEAIRMGGWSSEVDALVCVPTHWTHSVFRTYYAPRVLTRVTSRATGIPGATLLRRIAGGPHQLNVPRSRRAENIRGKFALIPGARVNGARLCLIDDVSTTGATINECARTLLNAGARQVYAAVVAKVDVEFK